MIDIRDLFDDHGVHYVTQGPNTKKGNISIKCPFCGSDDKSEHMGINLKTLAWGCWRNKSHRGRNMAYLLRILLRVPTAEAQRLLGLDSTPLDVEALDTLIAGEFFNDDEKTESTVTEIPLDGFRRFSREVRAMRASLRFIDYLKSRGFTRPEIFNMAKRYGLMYAIKGDYKGRIIIPVTMDDKVVTYTSRHIYPDGLRYKTLAADQSVMNIKDTVYNFDRAFRGGRVLFITEGPVDAWKLDYFGEQHMCHAVALYNMTIEPAQLYFLTVLSDVYDRVAFVLDADEDEAAQNAIDELSPFAWNKGLDVVQLPKGVNDAGELNAKQVGDICGLLRAN